ncbi:MAG: 5-formyltetrahydrofolate cyclo-ligase [Candidatus ainarchaeum sp.]|nr:5-formyltetrahydrofolate cyclo-ligase [Candidatus ainarchaeum sp.]
MSGEEKAQLRNRMLALRKGIPDEEKHEMSKSIMERLFDLEEFHDAKTVAFYLSKKDEVDTWAMVEEAAQSKEVLLPIVKEKSLKFVYYEKNGKMVRGPYGIMEPVGSEFSGAGMDLMVVPLAAADRGGNRIGMGKGYYDRYLNGAGPKPKTLAGLCFGFQVVGDVPAEAHDVPLNIIITNKETVRVKK